MAELKKCANDFIFTGFLGEGSFSTVYLAKEVQSSRVNNREVAIKVCEKQLIRREKKSSAILREKKCLHTLTTNPSKLFIQLLCTFQDNDRLFFVMNYAKNGELLSLINQRDVFDENCCRFYAAEILLALEHLHKLGIVHRDLKPENILLNEEMHIQVTDFGSALIMRDNESAEQQPQRPLPESQASVDDQNNRRRRNSFVGTAHYVSPEMLNNKISTPSSDLWAFACILYQMISGSTPFRAPNEYLIFQKIINLEFEYTDDFSDASKSLITSILQKNACNRLGANDDIQRDGYLSIKSHPYFAPLANKWAKLEETTPPVSASVVVNKSAARNENHSSSATENVEPGLAEKQITRIMGLALHEDFDRTTINAKPVGILDISTQEMHKRLETQRKSNEFHQFVDENLILKQGYIEKKKGLFARKRMFLLTTGPHLYYVDAANMVLKGQVPFSKDMRPEAKNFKNFFIHTPNRSYILEDTSGNAPDWCKIVEEVREATYGPPSQPDESPTNTSSRLCNSNVSLPHLNNSSHPSIPHTIRY
ncbi:unnamed protein product [Medioppia subpectinata]|uniref:3-phosphoinositide-dependent protein kinase 1 n=1 Tax=Medioppia subpectinata TaxID=1979941 RepID=A0A7R9KPM3_9ACAR|nr:unnamed protein product [Medioppia subpectinata]CAG2107172.1 unnamed protein product [Medioppia subpectinata]